MGVDMPHYFGSDFLLRVRGFQMTRRSKPQAANMPGPTVHSAVRLAIVSPHDCPKAPPTGVSAPGVTEHQITLKPPNVSHSIPP